MLALPPTRLAGWAPWQSWFDGRTASASEVKAEMKAAGYALATEHAFLPNQYFLVFKPR